MLFSMGKGELPLSEEERQRYARQILLPFFGEHGQRRLKRSRVFIAGAGGLGSISAFYLVAAGVGRLRIVDRDSVSLSNLNRQLLHSTRDLGKRKVESAYEKLSGLNPNVEIDAVCEEMNLENIEELIGDADVIVDATDNIETRRVLNVAGIRKGIPFVYGGVEGLSGMVTTFFPPRTPCFECVFGEVVAKPRTLGVLGPVPGITASIQALEVIKFLLGLEGRLEGRLIFFSGDQMAFTEINIQRNKECKVCKTLGEGT